MRNDSTKVSYYNTLVFTIISGLICVGILFLLFVESFRKYKYAIITVEVGTIILIIYCIYKIISYQSKMENMKRSQAFALPFDKCPDYYIKKNVGDKTLCSNEYIIKDKYKKSWLMKVYPAAEGPDTPYDLPSQHNSEYNINAGSGMKYDKFILNELETSSALGTSGDKCNVLFNKPTDGNLSTYNDYHAIPWTSAKSRCEAFT